MKRKQWIGKTSERRKRKQIWKFIFSALLLDCILAVLFLYCSVKEMEKRGKNEWTYQYFFIKILLSRELSILHKKKSKFRLLFGHKICLFLYGKFAKREL